MAESRRIKIDMPPELVEKITSLAGARNKKEKRFGGMNYGNVRGSLQAHVIGMTAEAAVAHYFGVDVDERIFHNKGDDGKDLVIPGFGVTQVKSTTYWSEPWLRAELEHDKDYIETYLLVYVDKEDLSCVWMIGWLPRHVVVTLPKKRLVDRGPLNYVAAEKDLCPVPAKAEPAKDLLLRYTKAMFRKDAEAKELFNKVLERMTP